MKPSVNCPKCGGVIEIDEIQNFVKCEFCETIHSVSGLLNESDDVQIEKIRSKTQENLFDKKMQFEKLLEEERKRKERETEFKKSKASKLYIIFAIISLAGCILAFLKGSVLSGVIAIIQTCLFLYAWLMGMQVVAEKKHNLRVVPVIVACLLIIPYCIFMPSLDSEKLDWDEMVLGEYLPEPDADKCKIISNDEDSLDIYISNFSAADYKKYTDACADMSFTVDRKNENGSFDAYNKDGYRLHLSYFETNKKMSLNLDAPIKLSDISWPESEIGKAVPQPESKTGNISYDSDSGFRITVGNTTREQYNEYVKTCSEEGFNVNYSKGDTTYTAYNENEDYISISYIGNNLIEIDASIKVEETETEKETTTVSTTSSTTSTASTTTTTEKSKKKSAENNKNIRPEFKKAMDSYEEFIDEYVDFMEKYSKSDNVITLMKEYTEYMEKLNKYEEEYDKWEDEELSDAEERYYTDVQLRALQKINAIEY